MEFSILVITELLAKELLAYWVFLNQKMQRFLKP